MRVAPNPSRSPVAQSSRKPLADPSVTETGMGLFKNEAVVRDSPVRTGALAAKEDVHDVVAERVHWYNHARLHSTTSTIGAQRSSRNSTMIEMTGTLPDVAASKLAT